MDTEDAAQNEPVVIADILEPALAAIKPQADGAGVTLQRATGETSAVLRGDHRRLQKALFNLLSNAVKFNRKGGWVQIAVHREGDCLAIEVSDNGIGMPADAEALIARLFSQYDGSLARKHEGIGLGLTFAHRVAHYHDAALTISSTLGEGTVVKMLFSGHRVVRALEVA
jgi:signal transduction histidine kinase